MTTAVAIALYNGAHFIEKQLDTIRNQTVSPDKVVLCDDGSKDNTVQIVNEYISKYNLESKWFLYENETNLGYIRNFYKAISLCDTDLVFLSDQDDIWKVDKIEKMTNIMKGRQDIKLLCCKYGIIDANGVEQHSVVEPEANENGDLKQITISDVMRAYRWPGMLMCLRKDYFEELLSKVNDCKVAHDFMLIALSSDNGGFYEYNYLGAYHRRHDNNTAREEHRISKLLNLERKLNDINITKKLYYDFLNFDVPVSNATKNIISKRLSLLEQRGNALANKKLFGIIGIYLKNKGGYLRFKSFVCDVWLVLFGKINK